MISKNYQSGRSMIEMLGVLAIIGVLSVGGISGYSKAMAKYKLTKAQDQMTMLLMNIRAAYATSPSYSDLTTENVANWNLAPSDMVVGTSLYSTFGGAVTVAASGTGNVYFSITMEGLSDDACRSLATFDWGADGLVSITVGSSTPHKPGDADNGIPISLASGASYCSGNDTDIKWVYY